MMSWKVIFLLNFINVSTAIVNMDYMLMHYGVKKCINTKKQKINILNAYAENNLTLETTIVIGMANIS
jgi:hypothetical protein